MMPPIMPKKAAMPPRTGRYTSRGVCDEIQRLIGMSPRGTHAALSAHLGFNHPGQLTLRLQGDADWLVEHLGSAADFFEEVGFTLPEGWPLARYRGPKPQSHD